MSSGSAIGAADGGHADARLAVVRSLASHGTQPNASKEAVGTTINYTDTARAEAVERDKGPSDDDTVIADSVMCDPGGDPPYDNWGVYLPRP